MANFNIYFVIGKVGLILTLLFHLVAAALSEVSHGIFAILYIIFGVLLSFGSGKTPRMQRIRVKR